MLQACPPRCKTCIGAPIAWPKSPCRTSSCSGRRTFASPVSKKTFAADCAAIWIKPARNTIAASARFTTIPWIISIIGSWKYSPTATPRPSENIRTPRLFCGIKISAMNILGPLRRVSVLLLLLLLCAATPNGLAQTAKSSTSKSSKARAKSASGLSARQLEQLCRALKQKNSGVTYAQLSAFALRKSSGALGARAALALGYFDYTKGHYAQASRWLGIAQADPLLQDYALYWSAEANLALNHNAEALAQLKRFRHDYPDSVITDEALQSLAAAALALNQPAEIISALDAYPQTKDKPALLFLRAEAREQSAHPLQAAADYEAVYLRFPSNEQAREAGEKLGFLRSSLGDKLPAIPIERQIEHASTTFSARQWSEARNEYSHLLPQLTGADRERAELRIMECGVALRCRDIANRRLENYRRRRRRRTLLLNRELLPRHPGRNGDVGGYRIRRVARSRQPLDRIGALSRRQLLLGATRSRPGSGILQAPVGQFPDVDRSAPVAMARRLDCRTETRA